MASQTLPQDEDFSRFIQWLRGEVARRGDPLDDFPHHKETSSAPPLPMTDVEALAIGQNAGSFVLTGAPDLATFELDQVEGALSKLHELAYERFDGTQAAAPLRAVFVAAAAVQRGLKFGHKVHRAKGPQQASLRTALAVLPALIADMEGSGGAYWRGFCRQALAEAVEIWEG